MKATNVARDTTDCRSLSVIPWVMVKKTGIVPRGFVNVKKEVKQSTAKGKIVSIAANYVFTLTKLQLIPQCHNNWSNSFKSVI